ncbi:DUF445 family protein [Treponema sp.]
MKQYYLWLLPPLVGAIIGYVTNALAIKMLFRPLEAKRFLGLRLPLTPGILPRQRHKLALNIGSMVARELITAEILRERIARKDFYMAAESSISSYTEKLINQSLFSLVQGFLIDQKKDPEQGSALQGISTFLSSVLNRFLASPSFDSLVDKLFLSIFSKLSQKSLLELFSHGPENEAYLQFAQTLNSRLEKALGSDKALQVVQDALLNMVAKGDKSTIKLTELLSLESREKLSQLVYSSYPGLSKELMALLHGHEVRRELEKNGRVFLRDTILKLNVFQRFFISAAQYDKTLHERMPEIVDDLLQRIEQGLSKEATRLRFAKAVDSFLENTSIEEDTLKEYAIKLSSLLLSSKLISSSSRSITEFLSNYARQPLHESATVLGLDITELGETAARALKKLVRSYQGEDLDHLVFSFVTKFGESSIRDFAALDEGKKKSLDAFITQRLLAIADDRITDALSTLDVKSLVSDRVDSLDMEDVERIVLDVLSDQLRWINVFGALLGALIGLAQVMLTNYLR